MWWRDGSVHQRKVPSSESGRGEADLLEVSTWKPQERLTIDKKEFKNNLQKTVRLSQKNTLFMLTVIKYIGVNSKWLLARDTP